MSIPAPPRQRARPLWVSAAVVIAGFVGGLYVIEGVDTLLGNRLDSYGVIPREPDGFDGILFAPLLHYGWVHLFANTVPLLVLGYLILLSGIGRWAAVTAVVWLVGGFGTWLTGADNSIHLGASVLVFGWLVYLVMRGIFTRRVGQVLIGVVVLFFYGGALYGVLPTQEGVSWQGHLFGAIGGGLAAWWFANRDI
jgi:membrane associated rhomboid family serine protease